MREVVNKSMNLLNSRECFQDLKTCCIKPMSHTFESFICKAYLGLKDSKIPWDNFSLPDKDPVMAVYVFFLYEYNINILKKLMQNRNKFNSKSRRLLTRWFYRVKRYQDKKKAYILKNNSKKQPLTMSIKSALNKRPLTTDNLEEHNRLTKRVKKAVSRYADDQFVENAGKIFKDDENCSDFDDEERVSNMSKSERSEESRSAGSLKDFIVNSDDEEDEGESSLAEEKEFEDDEESTDAESFDSDKSGWD